VSAVFGSKVRQSAEFGVTEQRRFRFIETERRMASRTLRSTARKVLARVYVARTTGRRSREGF
jgi:hypothetical protein